MWLYFFVVISAVQPTNYFLILASFLGQKQKVENQFSRRFSNEQCRYPRIVSNYPWGQSWTLVSLVFFNIFFTQHFVLWIWAWSKVLKVLVYQFYFQLLYTIEQPHGLGELYFLWQKGESRSLLATTGTDATVAIHDRTGQLLERLKLQG